MTKSRRFEVMHFRYRYWLILQTDWIQWKVELDISWDIVWEFMAKLFIYESSFACTCTLNYPLLFYTKESNKLSKQNKIVASSYPLIIRSCLKEKKQSPKYIACFLRFINFFGYQKNWKKKCSETLDLNKFNNVTTITWKCSLHVLCNLTFENSVITKPILLSWAHMAEINNFGRTVTGVSFDKFNTTSRARFNLICETKAAKW